MVIQFKTLNKKIIKSVIDKWSTLKDIKHKF